MGNGVIIVEARQGLTLAKDVVALAVCLPEIFAGVADVVKQE